MNRTRTALLAATVFIASHALGALDLPKLPDLASQLADGTAPAKTAEDFEAAYAKVLPPFLAKPEGDDTGLQKVVFRASRPGAEVERAALAKVLLAKLGGGEVTVPQKVLLLRHVQRLGRDESVPALTALLGDTDAQVRDCARRALANIPTKAAADALRRAIETADEPGQKGAVLQALAFRRDPADAAVFAKAAAETDDAVRIPALVALARTGGPAAAPVLKAARDTGSDAAKAAANDAYLLLADRLVTMDQRQAAASMYREYLYSPHRYRYAAIIGLAMAGGEEDMGKILNLLNDKDAQARGAALDALAKRRDPGTANEIMSRLAKADAAAKPWLIRALIGQGDRRVKQVLIDAAGDVDETVRVQAITGLAQVADAGAAVPVLLKSAATKGEEQVAARNTLDVLAGKPVDDALLERIGSGPVPERTEVIRALGSRRTAGSVDPLFAAATDAETAIRSEAFKSLALVAEFDALPKALGLVNGAKEDGDREQAAKAVVAIARKNDDADARSAPLLAELARADGPVRTTLLGALGQLGGDRALAAIRSAIAETDEKTHEAGVRALANWPDDKPLADLLTLAKAEKGTTLAVLSLRGYIRIAGLPTKRPAADTVKLFQDALAAARRPDEKKSALGGLGEVKEGRSLEVVAPYLAEEALAGEACAAAIKIAREISDKRDATAAHKELARTTMAKVLEASKSEGQKKAAKEIAEKLSPPAGGAGEKKG